MNVSTTRRLNRRAAAALAALILAAGALAAGLHLTRTGRLGDEAAAQIRDLVDRGDAGMALRHLGQYLERFPNDEEMLFLQARLMGERATRSFPIADLGTLERVARMHQALLSRSPDHPEIGEVRVRLAELYILMSDSFRAEFELIGLPDQGVFQERYRAAANLAEQTINAGTDGDGDEIRGDNALVARAYALRGRALEGVAEFDPRLEGLVPAEGGTRPNEFIRTQYERALDLYEDEVAAARSRAERAEAAGDPDEIADAEEALEEAHGHVSEIAYLLALFHRDRRDDPEAAEAVLDRLVGARPDSVNPLLIRYRYYQESRDRDRARRALEDARDLAPEDPKVRLSSVNYFLNIGEVAEARAQFEAIPREYRDENPRQIRLTAGLIDYFERPDPDPALNEWRQGLLLVDGSDADLTWWLAYVQILEKRFQEADPLIEQFGRLSGGGENPRYRLLLALRDERSGKPERAIAPLRQLVRDDRIDRQVRGKAYLTLARCLDAVGDRGEADRIYRMAAQADPRSPAPVVEHAQMLERSGRVAEAIGVLSDAMNARGDDLDLLMPLLRLHLIEQASRPGTRGRSWAEFDRVSERAQRLLDASNIDGGGPAQRVDLELMRVDRELLGNRAEQAEARLDRAVERWPNDSRVLAAHAEMARRRGRPDEAIRLLDEGLDRAGDSPTLRIAQAGLLVELGRGREAQRRLLDGIEDLSEGRQARLWEAVGRLRAAQADYDGAREAFERWRAVASRSPEPILALIEVALKADRLPEAELHLRRLGQLNQEQGTAFRLAEASITLQKAERANGQEAAELLEQCDELVRGILQETPELAEAHMLRGRVLEAREQPESAVESYRKAWEQGDADALLPLAELLARLGRYGELERLDRSDGGSRVGRVAAQVLHASGAFDQASQVLEEAAGDPNAPALANALRAQRYLITGELDKLESMLREEAARAGPGEMGPWVELIATQARLGRGRATLEKTIDQALERASRVPAGLLEAHLRWAAGDAEAADEALEDALGDEILDPDLMIAAASYYRQTGRPDRAEPLLERLLTVRDVGRAAALELAMLMAGRASGDPETWERARKLAADGPDSPERRLAVAIVEARAPDPDRRAEAIPLFETVIADLPTTHPRAVEARDHLARLLVDLGRAERALQISGVSANQLAPDPGALALHVRTLMRAGRTSEAGSYLDRLELLKPPGDPEVVALRADLLLKAGDGTPRRLEEAVEDRFRSPGGDLFARAACMQLINSGDPEAIEAAGRIAETLSERFPKRRWVAGLVMAIGGRSTEALERCSSALDGIDLSDEADRIGLTEAVLRAVQNAPIAERPEAVNLARPIIDAMLERRPGDPDFLTALARLSHQEGDYRREAELYRQALRRRPGDPVALYNLSLVLSEGLDRAEEALEAIDGVAERIGTIPEVLGARGVILTRLGRYDEAIRDLERAIELNPTADRYFYLARAHRKAGRDEQFRSYLEQAKRGGLTPDAIDRWHHDELDEMLAS